MRKVSAFFVKHLALFICGFILCLGTALIAGQSDSEAFSASIKSNDVRIFIISGSAVVLDADGRFWRYKEADGGGISIDRERVLQEKLSIENEIDFAEEHSGDFSLSLREGKVFERKSVNGIVQKQEVFLKTANGQAVAWAKSGDIAAILLDNGTVEWVNLSKEKSATEEINSDRKVSKNKVSIAFHDVTAVDWAMQPVLQIIGGNNQEGIAGEYAPLTLDVGVVDGLSVVPLSDIPVTFSVVSGGGLLAKEKGTNLASSLTVLSDEDGVVSAFYKLPLNARSESKVSASSGNTSVQFNIYHNSTATPPMLMSISPDPGGIFDEGKEPPKEHLRLWLSSFNTPTKVDVLNDKVYFWGNKIGDYYNGIQNTVNNRPSASMDGTTMTVRFNGDNYHYLALGHVMNGLAEGEVFIVLKTNEVKPSKDRGLWYFGGNAAVYPKMDGSISESFGTTVSYSMPAPSLDMTDWHIYNVSAKNGHWAARFNGDLHYQTSGNTVSFYSSVLLGHSASGYFDGNIVEMLVYDKVLTDTEREEVGFYLENYYNLSSIDRPEAPTDLKVVSIGEGQLSLTWKSSSNALYYTIERKTKNEDWATVGDFVHGRSFIDTVSTEIDECAYRVRAINYTRKWACSNEVTVIVTSPEGSIPLGNTRLWLKAETLKPGRTAFWNDVSGKENHGSQSSLSFQPEVVSNGFGDYPVVRFDGVRYEYFSFGNVMKDAAEGEVFIVVKAKEAKPSKTRGLWMFGGSVVSSYPYSDGSIREYFGSKSQAYSGVSVDIAEWNIYNVSGKDGYWANRFNGKLNYHTSANTVAFTTNVLLGYGANCSFAGDMAEVIVFDKVLNEGERDAVGRYLGTKYSLNAVKKPNAPTDIKAHIISSNQISLTWKTADQNNVYYIIERKTDNSPWEKIGKIYDGRSFIDSEVTSGQTYSYRIKAESYAGTSDYGNTISLAVASNEEPIPFGHMRLWLRAETQSIGRLSCWTDLSGRENHGSQSNVQFEPEVVANGFGDYPVVRFDGVRYEYFSLGNVMKDATEGEVFIVVKANEAKPSKPRGLWTFTNGGVVSSYPYSDGSIREYFGSKSQVYSGVSADIAEWNIYNVSAKDGYWVNRFNGKLNYHTSANTVAFTTNVLLGYGANCSFAGDMAEVIVFDKVLNEGERDAVGRYLGTKYNIKGIEAPVIPTNLKIFSIGNGQASLTWKKSDQNNVYYIIERKTNDEIWEKIGKVLDGNSFIDSGLDAGKNYMYRIRAESYAGTSLYTSSISLTVASSGTPIPLSNMRLWLKSETQNIGPLSCWADQSGKGFHGTQTSLNYQPKVVEEGLVDHSIVRFTPNTNISFENVLAAATEAEVFAVLKVKTTKPSADRGLWHFGARQTTAYPDRSGAVVDAFASNSRQITGVPPIDLTQWHLYNVSSKTGYWANRFNGKLHYETTSNTFTAIAAPSLGTDNYSYYFDGDIAEVIIFDKVLSGNERGAIEEYFYTKYGLATIASTDPNIPSLFQARLMSENIASLEWVGELEGITYAIERSVNGSAFEKLATVSGLVY